MNFQEAITALAIERGDPLPKSSNHDQPERRAQRMIQRGWLTADGSSLTPAGAAAAAEYGTKEGWHPESVARLRALSK